MKDFSLTFYARKTDKKNSDKVKIYGRITIANERLAFSVNRTVKRQHWDNRTHVVKAKDPATVEVIKFLQTIEETFFKVDRELFEKGIPVNASALLHGYRCLRNGKQIVEEKTLFLAFDHHLKELEELCGIKAIVPATLSRYRTTKSYIAEFLKLRKAEDIGLSKLDYGFIKDFHHFLLTKKACIHNTSLKHIKNLKKVVRVARDYKWISEDPFLAFRESADPVEREYLTIAELRKLEELKLDIERLDRIRKLFLFSCYTGLAFVDMFALKEEHMEKDNQGFTWIIKPRQKTKVVSRVVLLPRAEKIMEEFSKDPLAIYNNTLFPRLSNQKVNGYLKELAVMIGTTKNLTFHVARHTFATTVTLANGISIEAVSSMLGHTNITQTQHYAKMVASRVGSEMNGLREMFG